MPEVHGEKLVQASIAPALMSAKTCFADKVFFVNQLVEPSSKSSEGYG